MDNKVKIAIALFIVVLIVGGIWYFSSQKPVTQVEGNKVRVGYLPILASLPFYIAEKNGYFTELGIEIEKVPIQTGEQLNEAFIRGEVDITPENTMVPVLRTEIINPGHTKIFALGDITNETPFATLIVKNNSIITTLTQLEGKKVGVFPGGTSKNLLPKFLKSKSINTEKIEFVEIPPTSQLQALSSGAIDALLSYEPTTAIAIQGGEYRKLYADVWASLMNHNPLGSQFISSKFINEKPNLAKKTVDAFNKANLFMKTNDKEMRDIIVEYVKLKPEVAAQVVPLYYGQTKDIDPALIQQFISILVETGEIKESVDANFLIYKP